MAKSKATNKLPHYHIAFLAVLLQIICYLLIVLFNKRQSCIEFVQTVLSVILFITGGIILSAGVIELFV